MDGCHDKLLSESLDDYIRSKRIGLFTDNALHASVFREIFYYIYNFHDIKYFSMLNLSLLHSTLVRWENSISMVVNNIKLIDVKWAIPTCNDTL